MKIWSILHLTRPKSDTPAPLPEPVLAPESMPWPFVGGPVMRGDDRAPWWGGLAG